MFMTGAYILGILTVKFCGSVMPVLLLVILSLSYLCYSFKKKGGKAYVFFTVMILLISCLLFDYGLYSESKAEEPCVFEKQGAGETEGLEVSLRAVAESVSVKDGRGRIEAVLPGKEKIIIFSDAKAECGDILEIEGNLYTYPSPKNDGEFDTKAFYACRNICAYTYVDSLTVTGKSKKALYSFKRGLQKLRTRLNGMLIKVFGEKRGGVLSAMFTGDKSGLEQEIKDSYKSAGIGHLLAISGLHVSLIGLGIYGLLRRMGKSIGFSGAVSMLFLGLFAVFTGEQVSCIRAMIMMSFMVSAKYFGRKYDPYTAISFAALVVLVKNPLYLTDPSFLLSFGAGTAAAFSGELSRKAEIVGAGKLKEKLIRAVIFGFSIQFLLLPLQLMLFYSYNIYSPFVNLLLIPLMPVLFASAVLSLICLPLFPAAVNTVSLPARFILDLYSGSGGFVGELPGGRIVTGTPGAVKAAVSLVIILTAYFLYTKEKYKLSAGMLFLEMLLLIHIPQKGFDAYQLYVGQGACYVMFSDDKVIVCDCGSGDMKDIYANTLLPFLEYHGFYAPDYVIVTHADKDHFSGIEEYLEEEAETVFIVPLLKDYKGFEALTAAEEARRCEIVRAEAFKSISLGKLRLDVFYPDEANNEVSENDSSLVFRAGYDDVSVLFTGDISAEKEDIIIRECRKRGVSLAADSLIVSHHGSRYSTGEELLKEVSPKKAYISCGINNSYGHPAGETISRLKKAGCEIHISSKEGQVKIR